MTFCKVKTVNLNHFFNPVEILVMAAVFVPLSALVMNAFAGDSEDDFDFLEWKPSSGNVGLGAAVRPFGLGGWPF